MLITFCHSTILTKQEVIPEVVSLRIIRLLQVSASDSPQTRHGPQAKSGFYILVMVGGGKVKEEYNFMTHKSW